MILLSGVLRLRFNLFDDLCRFAILGLDRLLSDLIGLLRQRVAILVNLIVVHIRRADVLTADGIESETQLGTVGIDDDLFILGIDGDDLADNAADGDDFGARLQIRAEILAFGLLLLGLARLAGTSCRTS